MLKEIWEELDRDSREYAEAKHQFDTARIRFEVAKRRFAGTKEVARKILNQDEWRKWQVKNQPTKYVDIPIGEGILQELLDNAYDVLTTYHATYDTPLRSEALTLDEIVDGLDAGGFEFKSMTPAREVNAALINLSGVEKRGTNSYRIANFKSLEQEVESQIEEGEQRERRDRQEAAFYLETPDFMKRKPSVTSKKGGTMNQKKG